MKRVVRQYVCNAKHVGSYAGAIVGGPASEWTILGQNVNEGGRTGVETDELRGYFSLNKKGNWAAGLGNVPEGSVRGFGGGIPMIVNGQKYGEEAGEGILPAKGYANQNSASVGKVIVAFNSKTGAFMLVVSPDELKSGGMTLDQIRDKLSGDGYDNALSFDGGSSSTLIRDGEKLVTPKWYKNNSIPTGLHVGQR